MSANHSTGSCCHDRQQSHSQTLAHELMCHFPYAIFAVAMSLAALSLLGYGSVTPESANGMHGLFHTLHFLHILFASTGTVIVFRKFGGSVLSSLVVGSVVPAIFCTLSDAIMPYLGGKLFGIHMHFHWCFHDHFFTVGPFLAIGVLNGLLMSMHDDAGQDRYLATSHFLHIFISAFASTVYMISHGFYTWQDNMAFVFVYLLAAVLVPCTLADVVVPTWFGLQSAQRRARRKDA